MHVTREVATVRQSQGVVENTLTYAGCEPVVFVGQVLKNQLTPAIENSHLTGAPSEQTAYFERVVVAGRSIARREDVREAAATLDAIQNEIAGLKEQVELATDKVIVERKAREDMSLIREGDKLYRLSVDPSTALQWPLNWPLPGLRHLLIGN